MEKDYSLFNQLDIFGTEYNFLIHGNKSYKTKIGAWMTLFYIFLVIGLFFGFGIDLYQRKNPKVSLNSENFPYEPVKLSNQNFTYAYRIEDVDGILQLDESVAKLKVYYAMYEMINGSWVTIKDSVIPGKRCYDFPYYQEKEKMYNISLQSWYCVEFQNKTWGGNWDGNFVNFFRINVEVCMNSTSNNTCATKEKIESKFYNDKTGGNLFFSDLSLYVQPALNNYEKPIATTLVNNYQMLNLDLTKRKVQTYRITSIDNDVGWFFEDIKQEYVINTNDILTDFTFKDRWTQPVLYNSMQYMGKKVETYRRSYTKIQEVFAAIGGFAKIFYTILVLLFNNVRKAYNNLILINSIPFNEDFLRDSKNQLTFNHFKKIIRTDNLKLHDKIPNQILEKKSRYIPLNTKITYYDYLCHFICKKNRSALNYTKIDNYSLYKSYFEKKLDILSYFDIHHKFTLIKKVLLTKDFRSMIKLINPKLKNISKKVPNYTRLGANLILSKNSSLFLKHNSSLNLDEKSKILIGLMEEDVRKFFE